MARAPLRRLERPRLYEQVVQRLLEHVSETGLRPGQRLPPERLLAEDLGISRASVREAIVALEVEGIVDVRHGDGTYLRRAGTGARPLNTLLGDHQHAEVMETREALEVKIAELAAHRRTEEDLDALDRALAGMAADLAQGGDGSPFDAEFHTAVTFAAHNALMAELMDRLTGPIQRTRMASLTQPERLPVSLAGHHRIADAIRRSDPQAAATAMRDHLGVVGHVGRGAAPAGEDGEPGGAGRRG
jgi:GntR family transcriptional repressor for pyruvate dehydrogenase complex